MKVVAFGASSSKNSINRKLAAYAANLIDDAEVDLLDLNDFEMPIFSEDREKENGHPQAAHDFLGRIANADAIIVSFAEHNGSYSAAFKNIFDWCSRVNREVYQGKPMLMLSTSPGARGGAGVLSLAVNSAKYFAGDVKADLSIGSFYDVFDQEKGLIRDESVLNELKTAVSKLQS